MSGDGRATSLLPPQQQAIRARCFHRSGNFVEFPEEEVERSIPERFEKIVRRFPDRIAVKTRNQILSYSELNATANRVAHALLERGERKARLVAILMEKDAPQLAAMLGVMKAGKFFLILDTSFPRARLAAMLEDSRARLVLTHREQGSMTPELAKGDLQFLEWEDLAAGGSAENPGLAIPPKALAFINYTSGSTGEPKGLLRTHRMILHNIMLRTNLVHVCEHDRISLLSSGTSNAITNTFLALLNGAGVFSLDLKKENVVRLAGWLNEERITISPMSSPLFRSLCETLSGRDHFPDLRVVRLRSEAVYKNDAELYKTYFSPNCIFVTGLSSNETGPLRDFLVDHRSAVSGSAVPVGYPVPGKEILLLDDSGNEIAPGEEGEIAVRSRYLSPGYLRKPQLTRAKFGPGPKGAGERLYRTGDLGVLLPDGCLVYKGRKDFRIKIRGYGVDLKEIELALRHHSAVADAVVVARENESREKVLVAYFTASSPIGPTADELRSFLGQTLADYMIPSAFVKLDSIPLTPHNKVDRNALPPPGQSRPDLGIPFRGPRTPWERELGKIWAEVLDRDQIGVDDNFFDLGGHSLAATRIISRVIQTYGLQVPPQALFDSPTVAKMAAVVMGLPEVKGGPPRISHGDGPQNRILPAREFVEFKREEIEQSIPDRFEKIVRLYPDHVAIKIEDRVLTYRQLNATADCIARAILAERGPGNEPVAVLVEHGAELVAAILGVLKAGKFFLVLDAHAPLERNSFILGDSGSGLVITNRRNIHRTAGLRPASLGRIDVDALNAPASAAGLGLAISPDALACLIYTSGSTGDPKGVVQNHRNLLHASMRRINAFRIGSEDRMTLLASGSNQAVMNILSALLNGARLCPFDVKQEGANRLGDWLIREGITIYHSSASLFRQFAGTLTGNEDLSNIRLIRSASETVTKNEVELYRKHFSSNCLFANGLSTTETGTSTFYFIGKDTPVASETVPVGYPLQDMEILLLDEDGNRLGFDRIGEIAVRSRYLAIGYWRRPDLTQNKFLPDPEGGDRRIYLTGDFGRLSQDGCLEHLGRKEFLAKVRGYRVETGEVELNLLNHPGVKEAAVVSRESGSGESRLVAYVVPVDQPGPGPSDLRAFLKKTLPEYMLPSAFVMLDAMPLTPNGKVDRRSLPDPKSSRPELDTRFVAPGNSTEKTLVEIWSEVLGLDSIGIHDNFFELGGDSLLAARILSRIHENLEVEVSVGQLLESPTVAALAGYIDAPGTQRDRAGSLVAGPAPGDRTALPSFAQQRLWFLDQLEPGRSTYNLFSAHRFKGRLNATVLERSLNEIIRRHETLRTTFEAVDGQPFQVIHPSMTIPLPIVELRGIGSDIQKKSEFRRLATTEAQRPFDLARGPLLRATLLRLTDDEHVLLLTLHHIVFDGWSRGILARELATLYEGFRAGRPSSLPSLPIQYADFALWQREGLDGEVLGAQLAYWKKQLENVPALRLPIDQPHPSVQTARGARRYFALSKTLSAALKSLSHRDGATLFMTLLAAYQILLHRYTGQDDVVVGAPTAGRNRSETESLIGFFLNMLVLRADLSGNPTFREFQGRIRETCLGAYAHQDVPFEKLVEELQPERDLNRNPLFQATFALQNAPAFPLNLAGLLAKDLELDPEIARFDLHLFLEEDEGGLKGYINYKTDLFSPEMIGRMIGHFQALLESIAADPEKRLSDLPLLTAAERRRLLMEWNETKTDYPKDKCLHQLFEEQAERTPEAIAVTGPSTRSGQAEDQQLTYRDLNRRANRLANYLQKLGVGPEVLVGVYMERSLEMVMGLLGILKAGGAYVPLDPAYPGERLAFMLDDSKAGVLLTQEKMLAGLPEHKAQVVCLDRDCEAVFRESEENPAGLVTAGNLAYLIYTSGSTGRPKAVAIEHRSAAALVHWAREVFAPQELAGVLASTSICFDLSVFELFLPLTAGGKVILAENVLQLPTLSAAEEVTLINTVPSAIAELLKTDGMPASVRAVNLAGEPLPTSLVEQLYRRAAIDRVYDLYGPSEDTTYSTFALRSRQGPATIGRPIANTRTYILDLHLQPAPVGVRGEICIGGDGLARGYLHRPELTAENFIPDPFGDERGARMYKTGDMARYLPDGNIEFLGRIDHQVKIRGFRVELGEVEAVLGQNPAVQRAVVTVREDAPGDPSTPPGTKKRLVAYVVAKREFALTTGDLRGFLKDKLPEYMIPSAFVMLDALPLNPNGKIDRRALPAPDQSRPELNESFVLPRSSLEKMIAKIWAQVLKLDRIGVHDNFFDLGGHSLLATQVVSRLREAVRMEIPLRALFENPTVEELAVYIEKEAKYVAPEETTNILADVESLSDEEAKRLVSEDQQAIFNKEWRK